MRDVVARASLNGLVVSMTRMLPHRKEIQQMYGLVEAQFRSAEIDDINLAIS